MMVLVIISAFGVNAQEKSDHPEIGRYGESSILHQELGNLNEYTLALGAVTDEAVTETLKITGKLMMTLYRGADDVSAFEIYTAYKEFFNSNGYEILFTCSKEQCGDKFLSAFYDLAPFASDYGWNNSAPITRGNSDFSYVITAKKEKGAGTTYVNLIVSQGWWKYPVYKLDVIEVQKQLGKISSVATGREVAAGDRGVSEAPPRETKTESSAPATVRVGLQMSSDSYFGLIIKAKHLEFSPKGKFFGYDGYPDGFRPDDLLMIGAHLSWLQPLKDKIEFGLGLDFRQGIPVTGDTNYKLFIDAGLRISFNYSPVSRFMISGIFHPFWVRTRETYEDDSFTLDATIPTAAVAVSFIF